jgi:pimeloyl-ACP methyl ester carboxylesterase
MRVTRFLIAISVICLLGATGISAALPPDTEVVTGEWQGALYAMYVPASWNGSLALYAHGYVAPNEPIAMPSLFHIDEFRDMLLEDGYAVAYSSYSENGLAVRGGFKETEHLLPLFRSSFGSPSSVYVIGHSMGGLIAVMLAEKHHGKYDGALPICGIVGGGVMAIDYVTEVRILFDAYYPGVIPGGALDIPEAIDVTDDVVVPVFGAIFTDPLPAMEMSSVEELGMYWADVPELADSTVTGLWFNVTATDDVLGRCKGIFFDNTEGYTHPSTPVFDPPILDEVTLNSVVEHYTIDKNCYAYLKNWYEPDGNLRIPVLTLHESRDPAAPIKHELDYASQVAAQGSSDWLVQRTKDAYGHCVNFSAVEVKGAFDELVLWAEQGVKPLP